MDYYKEIIEEGQLPSLTPKEGMEASEAIIERLCSDEMKSTPLTKSQYLNLAQFLEHAWWVADVTIGVLLNESIHMDVPFRAAIGKGSSPARVSYEELTDRIVYQMMYRRKVFPNERGHIHKGDLEEIASRLVETRKD